MKFKPDLRYVSIQSLKAIGYYLLGIAFCILCLHISDIIGFIVMTLLVTIGLFFAFLYSKCCYINDGFLIISGNLGQEKKKIKICDIKDVHVSHKPFNTIELTTNSGEIYRLHPKQVEILERIITTQK